jgi:ribosomal protein S17E
MKGTHLHVAAKKLMKDYSDLLGETFESNKKALHELGILKGSKEERNKLAGELTNNMKKKKKNEKKEVADEAAA